MLFLIATTVAVIFAEGIPYITSSENKEYPPSAIITLAKSSNGLKPG